MILFNSFNLNLSKNIDVSNNPNTLSNTEFHYTPFHKELIYSFKLPISYLDSSQIFSISDIVSDDLELTHVNNQTEGENCLYNYMFTPSHPFSKLLIPNWQKYYTTNIDFLQDTKILLINLTE